MNAALLTCFAIGLAAGAAAFAVTRPSQQNENTGRVRSMPPNSGTPLGAFRPKFVPVPAVPDDKRELDNDGFLRISDSSAFPENAEALSRLPSQILQKWVLLEPGIAIPWLLKNQDRFPPPGIVMFLGSLDLYESPAVVESATELVVNGSDDLNLWIAGLRLQRALEGDAASLNLSPEDTANIGKAASRRERLETIMFSKTIPLETRILAMLASGRSDPLPFEKALNANWEEFSNKQKRDMAVEATRLLSTVPMDLKAFKEKLIEVSVWTADNQGNSLTFYLMEFGKTAGVEEALDILSQTSARQPQDNADYSTTLNPLIYMDPGAASEWLDRQADGYLKNRGIEFLVNALAGDPDAALAWAERSTDQTWREKAVHDLTQKMTTRP